MIENRIFSTDTDDGVISVVDKKDKHDHKLVGQIRVGNAPRGGVKFAGGRRAFVCNTSQNTISELDVVDLEEVRRIEVGFGPRGLGIFPTNNYALVSNSGSDTVSVVDLEVNVTVHTVHVGRDPRHMAISADGKYAYVSIWGEGYISKLDISSLADNNPAAVSEVAQIDVGTTAHPYSVNIHPTTGQVFVANTQATYCSVIEPNTDVVTNVELGFIGGRGVAFTPDGEYAMVTLEAPSRVYVILTATLEVTRFIPVGPGPRGVAVDPDDDTLYISNFKRSKPTTMTADPDQGPDFAANSLTMVDLKSAPLDRQDGSFDYQEVTVGFGPCSVVMLDAGRLFNASLENAPSAELA